MTVGGMDSFFMSSAQFVYRNLCRAIASEFNKGPVNKIDKNIHDKVGRDKTLKLNRGNGN